MSLTHAAIHRLLLAAVVGTCLLVIPGHLVLGQSWTSGGPGMASEQEIRGRLANTTVNGLTSSIVQRSYERVLMRRKRFLIFPKGANIIVS